MVAPGPVGLATGVGGRVAAPAGLPSTNRYTIGPEIARGGLGRVLSGHDKLLDRTVALKELLSRDFGDRGRFSREVLVTARLQHPSIVPIYDAGAWPDGEPFYAMKLISGRSFEQLVRERPTLPERLALLPNMIDVAEAIAYAHSQRVIHRDLKPANVIVGEFGETLVIDWGLAKSLDAPEEQEPPEPGQSWLKQKAGDAATEVGAVMGTPCYMAP